MRKPEGFLIEQKPSWNHVKKIFIAENFPNHCEHILDIWMDNLVIMVVRIQDKHNKCPAQSIV